MAKLPNPVNDARAVAALLRGAGFDVVESRFDLDAASLRRAMGDFTDIANEADVAVVYYAGHGIEVDGNNYLIPVDAVLARDVDVEDETVSVDRVMKALDPAKRLRLVILDACRDNPFTRSIKRSVNTRSIGRGLAKVEVLTSDTLIAFAAKAGSTAMDGDGKNSPYTSALLKHLATPGLDVRFALGRVRDDVVKATSNRQEPFVYGSLGGKEFPLVPPADSKVAAPTEPPQDWPTCGGTTKCMNGWGLRKGGRHFFSSTRAVALQTWPTCISRSWKLPRKSHQQWNISLLRRKPIAANDQLAPVRRRSSRPPRPTSQCQGRPSDRRPARPRACCRVS